MARASTLHLDYTVRFGAARRLVLIAEVFNLLDDRDPVSYDAGDAQGHVFLGLALAYLGRKAESVREGERGVALVPIAKDSHIGPYYQHHFDPLRGNPRFEKLAHGT